jgi:uncharacterized phage protein gp47/JayE
LDEIRTELEARWRSEFGDNVDLSSESPDAQLIGIMAEREASLWEQAEAIYGAGNVVSATGAALDERAALTGLSRIPASSSTVTVTIHGTPGTVLAAGRVIRLADQLSRFTLPGATIGGGGTVDVLATAEDTGPVQALAGSTWEIVTPVTGWSSTTNALDANLGRAIESDAALRARIRRSQISVSNVADALRKAIALIDGVTEVKVTQNVLDFTDADGRPPHSFEVIVVGGADAEIAATIWDLKPDGIETYGTTTQATTDALGHSVSVRFTRPASVNIWLTAQITADAAFPANGTALVAAELLAYEAQIVTDLDIVGWKLLQGVETAGISNITLLLGRAASPSLTTPVVIGPREIAALDSSRITVTVVATV